MKDCGGLSTPNNGGVTYSDSTTYQSVATYSCDTGFELDGDRRRTCSAQGTWTGSEPQCIGQGKKIAILTKRDTIINFLCCTTIIWPPNSFFDTSFWHCNNSIFSPIGNLARDACLCMGEISDSTGSPFCFPYNCITVRRILFKFGRCMQ